LVGRGELQKAFSRKRALGEETLVATKGEKTPMRINGKPHQSEKTISASRPRTNDSLGRTFKTGGFVQSTARVKWRA